MLLKTLKQRENRLKVPFEDVVKKIRKLNTRKASQGTNTPVKILKLNNDIFGAYICDFFNECINTGQFPYIS